MKDVKKYLLVVIAFMVVGVGCALTMKANVGVGAWDALAKTTNDMTGIAIGTAGMIYNTCCVVGQILILRRKFKTVQILQIPLSIIFGMVVNFMFYNILVFPFDSFVGGCLLYFVANIIMAFGVALVMLLDEVTFALEGFCLALTKVISLEFAKIRQAVDVLGIILIIVLRLTIHIPWSIGAGTIIGMLTFGPMLGFFMRLLKPILVKYDFMNEA